MTGGWIIDARSAPRRASGSLAPADLGCRANSGTPEPDETGHGGGKDKHDPAHETHPDIVETRPAQYFTSPRRKGRPGMAKKQPAKMADTVDLLRPYLERALHDESFRSDLKDALGAARELYGPLSKSGSVRDSAKTLATDRKTQEQLRRAFEDLASAATTIQGKEKPKKSKKGRNALLLAGVIAGALYNPWTGPQTRDKLLDLIAGDDDLHALDVSNGHGAEESAGEPEAAVAAEDEPTE
jgi:hypothetical protein